MGVERTSVSSEPEEKTWLDEDTAAALLPLLFRHVPVAACILSPEDHVIAANEKWLRETGSDAREVTGRHILDLFPEQRELSAALHAEARARGCVEVPRNCVTIDGRETWWEGQIHALEMPGGTGLVILVNDVTAEVMRAREEQRRTEAETAKLRAHDDVARLSRMHEEAQRSRREANEARLQASEAAALLDAIFDHAPLGIGYWDRDVRFRRLNQALADINGLPISEHLGKLPTEVVPGIEGLAEIEQTWRELMDQDRALIDVEVRGETPKSPGRRRFWNESWYPVKVGGEVKGLAGLVRETTEEKQAKELYDLLVAIVSHDLRNPLSVISSAMALLRSGGTRDERTTKVLSLIAASVERMQSIIDLLRDYTLAQTGKLALRLEPTSLHDVCQALGAEMHADKPERKLEYRPGARGEGLWDRQRLAQVLSNLVDNGFKHGAQDRPVTLSWTGEDAGVSIEVANEGAPIPDELLPVIFEPLQRGERAGKTTEGLGLGLFISQQIVLAHNGRLEVSSDESQTVFRVFLPRRS